jgi:hypothetical protein
MNRTGIVSVLAACVLALTPRAASAETVDERIKRMEAAGELRVVVKERTTDACDKSCVVTFTSTTDGNVEVRPGETKYFKIDKRNDYTKSGGYYWKCCNSLERSRIRGATYIKVVRRADTGAFDQYWVEIEIR